MWTAASVLACALSVLGRSEASMPRIELIDIAPPYVSVGAEAFVQRGSNTSILITSSSVVSNGVGISRSGCTDFVDHAASSRAFSRMKSGTCATARTRSRRTSINSSR